MHSKNRCLPLPGGEGAFSLTKLYWRSIMAHLTKQERCKIENFLNAGVTLQEMSRNLNRSHTTISRELKRHRREEDPDHKRCTNYCVFSKKCDKYRICKLPPLSCLGKCSRCRIVSCNKHCQDFEEDKCRKLER